MPTWTGTGLIAGKADVEAAIAAINQNYRAGTEALAYPVRTADDAELTADASRLVPVIEELEPVVPWPGGLLRGATVAAVGSSSLLLALLAGACRRAGGLRLSAGPRSEFWRLRNTAWRWSGWPSYRIPGLTGRP